MDDHFIRCSCGACEHQAIIAADPDDGLLFVEFHLVTWQNILRRWWVAVRYVFGHRSRFGAWDELVIDRGQVEALRDYLDAFLDASK